MAAGASTVDVPASGGSGGTAVSCGRPCCTEVGHSTFNISVAPIKAATTTATAPRMIVRVVIKFISSSYAGLACASMRIAGLGKLHRSNVSNEAPQGLSARSLDDEGGFAPFAPIAVNPSLTKPIQFINQ